MHAGWLGLFMAAWGGSVLLAGPAEAARVQRVSVNTAGEQSNESRDAPGVIAQMSPDGRYVVFTSGASNLWPVDGNTDPGGEGGQDVFLRDRALGTTELVSRSASGQPGNYESWYPFVTADGRYVFFTSTATNLVTPAPPLWQKNLYVRDRTLHTTELVPLTTTGEAPNDDFTVTDITADGRYLLFYTRASNIVPGDTNGDYDAFLRDRVAGTTERVGLTSAGEPFARSGGSAITPEGRYVLFGTLGQGLYVRDRVLGTTSGRVDLGSTGLPATDASCSDLSPSGRYVVFISWDDSLVPGDTNECGDVFLRDRELGTTERISLSSTGGQGQWPDTTGTPRRVVKVSADGRYVASCFEIQYLVPSDNNDYRNVFLRDRVAGTTTLVDATPEGGIPSSFAELWAMSDDAVHVAFTSLSSDLIPGDTNNALDTFVWDREARFFDVPSCYWAFPSIEACVAAEVVGGYPDGTYRPALEVSRDQMAVFISRSLAGGDSLVPAGPATATFDDVPTDYWAFKYIEYAVDNGLVGGYEDGTYRPTLILTREAMAVFVARAMVGGEAFVPAGPDTAFFPDVPTDHWAFKYVEYIKSQGVTGGYPDGTYRPLVAVTRDQLAVYVQRAFDLPI